MEDCARKALRLDGKQLSKEAEEERVRKWSKAMILATTGLWTTQDRLSWYARTTKHDSEMPGPVRVTHQRSVGTVSKMCAQEIYDNATMLPVALLSLFDEQRRMYRGKQLVARVPRIVPRLSGGRTLLLRTARGSA